MVKFNLKKKVAKALVFAMVMGTVGMHGMNLKSPVAVMADEVTVTPVKAEVNYENMTLAIKKGSVKEGTSAATPDDYVFLEVMKKKDDTKQGTVYPYPCDGSNPVTVDLSFLKITKECYLRVWGDKSKEKVSLTVSAQPAKIKYKYAAQTFPKLKAYPEGTPTLAQKAAVDAENQQMLIDYYAKSFGITDTTLSYSITTLYHGTPIRLYDESGDGKWDFNLGDATTYTSKDDLLKNLKVTGTTLVICQMAKKNTYKTLNGEPTDEVDKAGHPMGTEVKIKIPAAPKAPKVTIDYAKGTIKLPKNAEYGIIDEHKIEYVALANGGTLSPKEILESIAKELKVGEGEGVAADDAAAAKETFVDTRLAAGFDLVVRTNDSKKGASIPTFISVKETVTYEDDGWGKITLKVSATEATEIATYEFSDEGVTVTVKSGSFEYEDGGKWKKIASGKVIKGKTSELTIRMAGVKDKDETKASLPSTQMTIKKPVDKSKVIISGSTALETAGDKKTTTLTVDKEQLVDRDGNGSDKNDVSQYDWKSSDITVATVAPTKDKEYEATVTAGDKAGKCTITVTITFEDKSTATKSIEIEVSEKAAE